MLLVDFFMWFFSNAGATARGKSLSPNILQAGARLGYTMKRKDCPYCDVSYWAYKDGNKYCGQFSCYRKVRQGEG